MGLDNGALALTNLARSRNFRRKRWRFNRSSDSKHACRFFISSLSFLKAAHLHGTTYGAMFSSATCSKASDVSGSCGAGSWLHCCPQMAFRCFVHTPSWGYSDLTQMFWCHIAWCEVCLQFVLVLNRKCWDPRLLLIEIFSRFWNLLRILAMHGSEDWMHMVFGYLHQKLRSWPDLVGDWQKLTCDDLI